MKSHEYQFRQADLFGLILSLLAPLVVFAVLLRLGAWTGSLPRPWPALDVDHTILTHQAQASQSQAQVDVLLVGDSSCLMDVSGKKLDEYSAGKHQFLNLGTTMYVGLNGYAALLSRFASVNPNGLRLIVVLLHPEMLRGIEPVPQDLLFISDYYSGSDFSEIDSVQGQLCGLFGLNIFRDRVWSRLPIALPKEYGRFYGFNLDLYNFMDQERGSTVDPHQFFPQVGLGNAEYRFSTTLDLGCQALRAAVPPGVKLAIGITPIPESFAPANYASLCRDIGKRWAKSITPEVIVTNLPAVMPDSDFASTTHLNQKGSLHYTEILSKCLEPYLDH